MNKRKLKIAITGGIGSGKSEFCNYLKEAGFTVLGADDIAKSLLSTHPKIRSKIISAFGVKSYLNSQPNIKYLSEEVFSDSNKVKRINAIIHPEVIDNIKLQMKMILRESTIVFVEAALIYEAEMEELFDYIIVITAEDEKKIQRIKNRSKVSEDEIKRRMENQIPDEEKINWADFVFENNGSLEELKDKAKFFLTLLQSIGVEN
ncbi:MAG: dephospho-CoA kinase [Ignavibacteriales bacterium]|nr:dephospho-CoA kinase [Ignavibacteriales bacterium]